MELPSLSTLVGLVNQQCTFGLGLMATSARARKRDGMVVLCSRCMSMGASLALLVLMYKGCIIYRVAANY